MTSVAESYRICAQLAHRAASNFYYTFYLLPHPKRMAMCAVYAYLRYLDDLADAPVDQKLGVAGFELRSELPAHKLLKIDLPLFIDDHFHVENLTSDQVARLSRLQECYVQFQVAINGTPIGQILPALIDTIRKFSIPSDYFVEVMRGMAMDVQGREYATWKELEKYCYRVASVVGLICLHIWDVKDERAKEPAIACGYAFQLTNILRDVGEDAAARRIYLPQEDLQSHRYSREDFFAQHNNDHFRNLVKHEIERARSYYSQAADLRDYLSADAVRMFAAMFQTYRELIDLIEINIDQLFLRRMRISRWRKATIAGRALVLGGKSIWRTMSEHREHPPSSRIAIIGGGIAGISTAVNLVMLTQTLPTASRPKIELFEARRTLGGRAGSFVDSQTDESLDLCQHVSMGCCSEFAQFIETIDANDDFRRDRELFFLANKSDGTLGRVNRMRATPLLPAPLHLGISLWWLRLDYLKWHEKLKIELTFLRLLMNTTANDDGKTTFAEFLSDFNVSTRVQELFFKPIVVSALSVSMDQASIAAARKVFVDAFMKSRRGYELLIPKRPISEILESRAIPWLVDHGVEVHQAAPVKRVVMEQNRVCGIQFADGKSGDQFINASHVVAAVPWMNVSDLFEPSIRAMMPEVEKLAHLEVAPIVSVHLWFDRAIMDLAHLVLPGRVSQWLFASPEQNTNLHRYQVVISAAYDELQMPRDELTQIILRELQEVLPKVQATNLMRSQVIAQSRAVFASTPGHEQFRPHSKASTVEGLYFAGDWTKTGWPATMESAVRSGVNAAQSIVGNL